MEKPWFRAKKYGLGWVPSTWQGWLVTFMYALLVTSSAVSFTRIATTSPDAFGTTFESDMLIVRFVIWILALTVLMLWVCYKTGEQTHWNWDSK